MAASTKAMKARINRIVLRVRFDSRPPTRSASTQSARPAPMRSTFLYDIPMAATTKTIRAMISRSVLRLMRVIVGYANHAIKPQPHRQRTHAGPPAQLVAPRGAGQRDRSGLPTAGERPQHRRGDRGRRVHRALDRL